MPTVRELHHEAMESFNCGQYHRASLLEIQAATKIPAKKTNEPTRSILYISAASIVLKVAALKAKALKARPGLARALLPDLRLDYRCAGALARCGLCGFPGEFHRRELRILGKQARHGLKILRRY